MFVINVHSKELIKLVRKFEFEAVLELVHAFKTAPRTPTRRLALRHGSIQ